MVKLKKSYIQRLIKGIKSKIPDSVGADIGRDWLTLMKDLFVRTFMIIAYFKLNRNMLRSVTPNYYYYIFGGKV